MGMCMNERSMVVIVAVWLGCGGIGAMLVIVMFVMHMPVRMIKRRMIVGVAVPLGQVQPGAKRHQQARDHECWRQRIPQQ